LQKENTGLKQELKTGESLKEDYERILKKLNEYKKENF
jgi:hypothetical protein